MRKIVCIAGLLALFMFYGCININSQIPPAKAEIRQMFLEMEELPEDQQRIMFREMHQSIGKPMLEIAMKRGKYSPGIIDEQTKVFVFKKTPERDLKIFVRYPEDWKEGDQRPVIIFWHGGGFTQGGANQFYEQAKYFNARGAVVAQPEYRIRDLDGTMPHHAIQDAISAMRWFKARGKEFGADTALISVGGGSAGGCIASVLGTVDAKKFAELGHVGNEDDQSISIRPFAMLLYNPFVDFFEPLNVRHFKEECLLSGFFPGDLLETYRLISAVDQLKKSTPPSIIMFGTRDAFYPQQIRWITKCRDIGIVCHDYVYKNEVHSWFNNSPHIEYTTENLDKFLIGIGFIEEEPKIKLPYKPLSNNRVEVQEDKYTNKVDWDEQERFQKYVKEHKIKIIPYKHYEIK